MEMLWREGWMQKNNNLPGSRAKAKKVARSRLFSLYVIY
jgi:hypothetical protein